MRVAGVVAAGIATWVAAPWIAMARRGTLDQQTVATWRTEPRRSESRPTGSRRPTPHRAEVPAPRASAESERLSA